MLNQHLHAISRLPSPVRPCGWAQGFISVQCGHIHKPYVKIPGVEIHEMRLLIWKIKHEARRPSHLFKNTSNLRLYAKPARRTLRCSIKPRYFTWCLISASSNWPVFVWETGSNFRYFNPAYWHTCLLSIWIPGCLDSFDFRQRMYQASLAMRISVSFSRLLLNWVATWRHNMRVIIPNSLSVRCIWLHEDTVRGEK